MSNGTPQTPQQVLDALAAAVRPFIDNEIPTTAGWNVNPGIQAQSLHDIGRFFTDVWGTLNALTAPTGQWVPWAAPTYVSATTFTVPGDQRTITPLGTRLRMHLGVPTTIVAVAGLAFDGAATTVTIDQAILTTALSAVDYGFVRTSVPKIGAADLQSVAVTTPALADGAVTNAKITGPIDYAKIGGAPPVLWTLTAGELVPSDLTTYLAVGRSTARARYMENPAVSGVFGSYANIKWAAGVLSKDVSSWPSWLMQFDLPNDRTVISRAPANSTTFTDLLTVNPADLRAAVRFLTLGTGTIKGRIGDANVNSLGDWQFRSNCSFLAPNTLDDTTKPAWTIRIDPTQDQFLVYRAPATTGAPTFAPLLTVDNTGSLIAANVVQAANGVRSGSVADGNVYLNPGTAGASGNPGYVAFYQAGTRKGYVGWSDGANRLMMVGTDGGSAGFHMTGNNICDGFFDHIGRGCYMAGPGNQVIATGAANATIAINSATYTDTSGMAFPQYNQIIAPAGRWWVLITAHIEHSATSCAVFIQQWNGSAWVNRQSATAQSPGGYGWYHSLAIICDSQYGSQFQLAFSNNAGGNVTLVTVAVTAVILGKSG